MSCCPSTGIVPWLLRASHLELRRFVGNFQEEAGSFHQEVDMKLDRQVIVKRGFDLILLGALLYAGLLATGVVRQGGRFEQGAPAPEVSLRGFPDGKLLGLADFNGKPLVLTFFSTSCPACKRELPDLEELKQELGDKINFLVVTGDDPKAVASYFKGEGLDLPLAYDPGGRTHSNYGVDTIPYNVVISAKGEIQHDIIGGVQLKDLQ